MSWTANKNHMLKLEAEGKANESHKAWLAKWRAHGSPSHKEAMHAAVAKSEAKAAEAARQAELKAAYEAKRKAAADKAAAEAARKAKLDADRPEGVSRYVWERVKGGTLNLNPTIVTRNPEVREALIAAGQEDWVKALHEKEMDERANHYMGNGASPADAWNTAQTDWYNQTYGVYGNETVANDSNDDLAFGGSTGAPDNAGYVPPTAPPPVVEDKPAGGNPGGMFGDLTDVVQDTRPPEETGPTAEEIAAAQAAAQAEAAAAAKAAAEEERRRRGEAMNEWAAGQAESQYTNKFGGGQGSIMGAYNRGKSNSAAPVAAAASTTQQSKTPWADAYLRSKKAAEAPGPVSGMMSKWME